MAKLKSRDVLSTLSKSKDYQALLKDDGGLRQSLMERVKQLDAVARSTFLKGSGDAGGSEPYDVEGLVMSTSMLVYSTTTVALTYQLSGKVIAFNGKSIGLGVGEFAVAALGIFNEPVDSLAGSCDYTLEAIGDEAGGLSIQFWRDGKYLGILAAVGLGAGGGIFKGSGEWTVS